VNVVVRAGPGEDGGTQIRLFAVEGVGAGGGPAVR
jgi:hypothetical protein